MSNENSSRESPYVSLCAPVGLSRAMLLDVARKKLIEFANSRLVYPSLGRTRRVSGGSPKRANARDWRSATRPFNDPPVFRVFYPESPSDLISKTKRYEN